MSVMLLILSYLTSLPVYFLSLLTTIQSMTIYKQTTTAIFHLFQSNVVPYFTPSSPPHIHPHSRIAFHFVITLIFHNFGMKPCRQAQGPPSLCYKLLTISLEYHGVVSLMDTKRSTLRYEVCLRVAFFPVGRFGQLAWPIGKASCVLRHNPFAKSICCKMDMFVSCIIPFS